MNLIKGAPYGHVLGQSGEYLKGGAVGQLEGAVARAYDGPGEIS